MLPVQPQTVPNMALETVGGATGAQAPKPKVVSRLRSPFFQSLYSPTPLRQPRDVKGPTEGTPAPVHPDSIALGEAKTVTDKHVSNSLVLASVITYRYNFL